MNKLTIENEDQSKRFTVMAEGHRQHIWNETTLLNVSKEGKKKINYSKERLFLAFPKGGRARIIGIE